MSILAVSLFFIKSRNMLEDEDCKSLKSCGIIFLVFTKAKIETESEKGILLSVRGVRYRPRLCENITAV